MLVYNCGSGYCMTGWLIYLVPHAIELGIQPYNASILATYGGIGNLLACIVYPVLKLIISDKMTLYLSTVLATLAFVLDPVISRYNSYPGLASLAIMFVFSRSLASMDVYKIVKIIVADDKMTNAILWLNVLYSIGAIASGFLSGKRLLVAVLLSKQRRRRQILKWPSFENWATFDHLFTFLVTREKLKFPSSHNLHSQTFIAQPFVLKFFPY